MEFVCFVWIWEQSASFASHNIKRLVFVTEVESVYCAVRTESLYITQWRTQEFCLGGGVQQIQLRTEDGENGDLGAVAP